MKPAIVNEFFIPLINDNLIPLSDESVIFERFGSKFNCVIVITTIVVAIAIPDKLAVALIKFINPDPIPK